MMSSVISARLEFQCGHAALVSLPRIKKEASAVRNERVAREKNDALTRRCDFCGPLVVEIVRAGPLAAAAVEIPPVLTNGHTGANGVAAEPGVTVVEQHTPVRPVAAVLVAPAPLAATPAAAPAELPTPIQRVAVTPVAVTPVAATPVAVKTLAPSEVATERARRASARRTAVAAPVRMAQPVRVAVPVRVASRNRYEVRFRVERVLQAANLSDALRLAESLGAEEVFEIATAD